MLARYRTWFLTLWLFSFSWKRVASHITRLQLSDHALAERLRCLLRLCRNWIIKLFNAYACTIALSCLGIRATLLIYMRSHTLTFWRIIYVSCQHISNDGGPCSKIWLRSHVWRFNWDSLTELFLSWRCLSFLAMVSWGPTISSLHHLCRLRHFGHFRANLGRKLWCLSTLSFGCQAF